MFPDFPLEKLQDRLIEIQVPFQDNLKETVTKQEYIIASVAIILLLLKENTYPIRETVEEGQ